MLKVTEIYEVVPESEVQIPLFLHHVPAGSSVPVTEYISGAIDFNKLLARNPKKTFVVTVTGESMSDEGINTDDILVVDTAQEPKHNDIVLAEIAGEMTVKKLYINGEVKLVPANKKNKQNYKTIKPFLDGQITILGVVKYTIKKNS